MEEKKPHVKIKNDDGTIGELEIKDYVRCEFKEGRKVTIARTERGSYVLSVDNPPESDRAITQRMHLTEGSVMALFNTWMLYMEHNGINAQELFQKYLLNGNFINYSYWPEDETTGIVRNS